MRDRADIRLMDVPNVDEMYLNSQVNEAIKQRIFLFFHVRTGTLGMMKKNDLG